jgi:hypothetical protein
MALDSTFNVGPRANTGFDPPRRVVRRDVVAIPVVERFDSRHPATPRTIVRSGESSVCVEISDGDSDLTASGDPLECSVEVPEQTHPGKVAFAVPR